MDFSHIRSLGFSAQSGAVAAARGERIEFIDLAKGVCILLVVLLHTDVLGFDIPNFKAVRMPLYFMLSGLFFRDYGKALLFCEKKFNRMIVPFLFFVFLHIGLFYLYTFFCHGAESVDLTWLYKPFTQNQYINVPVWFLICLFFVNVFYLGIHRIAKGNLIIEFLLCLAGGMIGYTFYCNDVFLPLNLHSVFTSLPFFFAGRVLGTTKVFYPHWHDRLSLPLGIVLIALSYGIFIFFGHQEIDFKDNQYFGNVALIYVNAMTFTIGIMMLCKSLRHVPLLSYMGRYSIIVLCVHYIYICFFINICEDFVGFVPSNCWYFFLILGLSVLSIPLCRRFLPRFTAQKDLIRISRLHR